MTTTATALVRHFRVGFAHLTLASPVNSSGHPGGMDAPPNPAFRTSANNRLLPRMEAHRPFAAAAAPGPPRGFPSVHYGHSKARGTTNKSFYPNSTSR